MPSSQVQSVRTALNEVLSANDTGSASDSNGRLVVMAPEGTQASIAAAIDTLVRQAAEDSVPGHEAPLRLRFWQIVGSAEERPADPRLDGLAPVLAEAATSFGLAGFELDGFSQIMVSPGTGFTARSGTFVFEGGASLTAGGVFVSADIYNSETLRDRIRADVVLSPGQTVILGASDTADGDMRLIIAQAETTAGG